MYPCLNEEAVFLEAGKRYFGLFTESEASANKQNNTTSATSGNIWNKYQARENTKFVKRGKTHNGCQARENMLQRPNAGTNLTGAKARENTERVLSAGKHVSARKHATLLIDRMFRIYSRSEKANAIQKVGFGGEWKGSLINPYRIEIC